MTSPPATLVLPLCRSSSRSNFSKLKLLLILVFFVPLLFLALPYIDFVNSVLPFLSQALLFVGVFLWKAPTTYVDQNCTSVHTLCAPVSTLSSRCCPYSTTVKLWKNLSPFSFLSPFPFLGIVMSYRVLLETVHLSYSVAHICNTAVHMQHCRKI